MQVFSVQGMTCGHCVRAVTQAVQAEDPQAQVSVDLATQQVAVDSQLTAQTLLELIRAEGYDAAPA